MDTRDIRIEGYTPEENGNQHRRNDTDDHGGCKRMIVRIENNDGTTTEDEILAGFLFYSTSAESVVGDTRSLATVGARAIHYTKKIGDQRDKNLWNIGAARCFWQFLTENREQMELLRHMAIMGAPDKDAAREALGDDNHGGANPLLGFLEALRAAVGDEDDERDDDARRA